MGYRDTLCTPPLSYKYNVSAHQPSLKVRIKYVKMYNCNSLMLGKAKVQILLICNATVGRVRTRTQQFMDEGTIKTPNLRCWLLFKIDLFEDFAAWV